MKTSTAFLFAIAVALPTTALQSAERISVAVVGDLSGRRAASTPPPADSRTGLATTHLSSPDELVPISAAGTIQYTKVSYGTDPTQTDNSSAHSRAPGIDGSFSGGEDTAKRTTVRKRARPYVDVSVLQEEARVSDESSAGDGDDLGKSSGPDVPPVSAKGTLKRASISSDLSETTSKFLKTQDSDLQLDLLQLQKLLFLSAGGAVVSGILICFFGTTIILMLFFGLLRSTASHSTPHPGSMPNSANAN